MNAKRLLSRRKKWKWILLCLLLAGVLYGTVIEPRWVEVRRLDIPLQRLPRAFDGLTVVHLTDFHYMRGLEQSYYRRGVEMTNRLHPELIVLTGDFLTVPIDEPRECANLLAKLSAPLGVYAVLGNHDYNGKLPLIHALESAGITMLVNQSVSIERGSERLWIVGLDDILLGRPDLPAALRGAPAADAKILLVHEPDYADIAARHPIDLQLSGHSHGGMVWLPLIGAPHLPWGARKYPRGLYQIGALTQYTSRGIGGLPIKGVPLRLNARPEITILTLRCSNRSR
ncbi:MAG: metallophosphoesterase [Armatimonadota bacterium]